MSIQDALAQLDPANNEHWTADGLPRMDALHALLGSDKLTRQELTNAAPQFNREAALKSKAEAETSAEDEQPDKSQVDPSNEPEAEADEAEADEAEADEAEADEAEADEAEADDQEADEAEADDQEADEAEADEAEADDQEADEAEANEAEAEPAPMSKMDHLQARLREAEAEMLEAQGEAESAKKRADEAANRVNDLNRKIEVLQKKDPNHNTAGIRAYIAQQNKNRMARARGIQRFMEANDLSPQDAANAADPRAPIDREMRQRKPRLGQGRPAYPRAVQR